jgi:hypothetical protein
VKRVKKNLDSILQRVRDGNMTREEAYSAIVYTFAHSGFCTFERRERSWEVDSKEEAA